MLPKTRQDLIDYVFRKLGSPVIRINVDIDQVNDRVDEAVRRFQEFHMDGKMQWYTSHQVTANDISNKYITMPQGTIGVTRIFTLASSQTNAMGTGGFNMFDINYQIRLNELYDYTAGDYVYFELANQHLRMLEMLFTGETPIRYNRYNNTLFLDMITEVRLSPGQYIIAEVFLDLDYVPGFGTPTYWGDTWLTRYTTALVKQQWGENLKKFKDVSLPGGMILNGKEIYDEAVEERKELEQQLRNDFEMPASFLVG